MKTAKLVEENQYNINLLVVYFNDFLRSVKRNWSTYYGKQDRKTETVTIP